MGSLWFPRAWPNVSRPILAGLIGTSANLGFMGLSLIAKIPGMEITPDQWRWVMVLGSTPAILAVLIWLWVPESPKWLAGRVASDDKSASTGNPMTEVFRPPLLRCTILGICLGTIPLMGNWGSANWTVPWAGQVGGLEAPALKASTQLSKSTGGAIGALLGGWLASRLGRRKTYFLISLISLFISFIIFRYLKPGDPTFLIWVFWIGFFGTLYFGWLPLYLPELFPTRVRATGSGVSFNFGRILTALGVLGTGQLMLAFEGDYARVGQVTCLIFVMGTIVILFAPDTSQKKLDDG